MNTDYGSGTGMGIGLWLFYMVVAVFYIFCMWKIFVKAGKPGWAAIVPIYNILVELEILGRPLFFNIEIGTTLTSKTHPPPVIVH
jgi:hypothetical protein